METKIKQLLMKKFCLEGKITKKHAEEIENVLEKFLGSIAEIWTAKKGKLKIMYAIKLKDKAGESIQLFHTRKLAEDYLEQIK